jgi:Uma2 family endonuclease
MAEPNSIPTHKMNADEFLVWAQQQEGKYELHDGYVVPKNRDPETWAMAPERVRHVDVKLEATIALRQAIQAKNLRCRAHIDGLGVRINDGILYEPDALVRCGEPLDGDAVEIDDPIIVVEVLSPSTGSNDYGKKLRHYFSLPSVQHYLVIDPEGRRLVHYTRQDGIDTYLTRILATGPLMLDPPGIEILVEDVFANLPPEAEDDSPATESERR